MPFRWMRARSLIGLHKGQIAIRGDIVGRQAQDDAADRFIVAKAFIESDSRPIVSALHDRAA
jgi:hypothetical protein